MKILCGREKGVIFCSPLCKGLPPPQVLTHHRGGKLLKTSSSDSQGAKACQGSQDSRSLVLLYSIRALCYPPKLIFCATRMLLARHRAVCVCAVTLLCMRGPGSRAGECQGQLCLPTTESKNFYSNKIPVHL